MNDYDARVGFLPRRGLPRAIYALVKQTWKHGRVVDPEPLTADLLRADAPSELEIGSDCWIDRPWTDVVVLGPAHAVREVAQMTVSVDVGRQSKRVAVFGQRTVQWGPSGSPTFSAAEPFSTMDLGWDRAYGGVDLRVPVSLPTTAEEAVVHTVDHPGLYPRNPYGLGYLVERRPVPGGALLPNLEDPSDLLTPERLVVGDASHWWHQPLPATLGYTPTNVFCRYALAQGRPWFSAPDDERLAEVASGVLPRGYLAPLRGRVTHAGFWQESAPGLAFPRLEPGTPITVCGMHPEGKTVRVVVPPWPRVEIELEGRGQRLIPKLDKVVLEPAKETMTLTWSARTDRMHRCFVPGVHAHIPLCVRVQNGPGVPYATPPTVRSRIDAGGLPPAPRPQTPAVGPRPRGSP